jgi:hypothetical protein
MRFDCETLVAAIEHWEEVTGNKRYKRLDATRAQYWHREQEFLNFLGIKGWEFHIVPITALYDERQWDLPEKASTLIRMLISPHYFALYKAWEINNGTIGADCPRLLYSKG